MVLEDVVLALVVERAFCNPIVLDSVLTEGRSFWPSIILHQMQQRFLDIRIQEKLLLEFRLLIEGVTLYIERRPLRRCPLIWLRDDESLVGPVVLGESDLFGSVILGVLDIFHI